LSCPTIPIVLAGGLYPFWPLTPRIPNLSIRKQLGGLRHTFILLNSFLSTLCSESVSNLHCYPKVTSFGSDPRMTRAKSGPEACILQTSSRLRGHLQHFTIPIFFLLSRHFGSSTQIFKGPRPNNARTSSTKDNNSSNNRYQQDPYLVNYWPDYPSASVSAKIYILFSIPVSRATYTKTPFDRQAESCSN
jgi:hypothetical protein